MGNLDVINYWLRSIVKKFAKCKENYDKTTLKELKLKTADSTFFVFAILVI